MSDPVDPRLLGRTGDPELTARGHLDIALHDLGGHGPIVLYAHATGFHAHTWVPIAARLTEFHNVGYDARGHGDTPIGIEWDGGGPIEWECYGRDAADVAATLQADGPIVGVGHSMGGAALLMAALASPRSFRCLVVYEPIVAPPVATGQPTSPGTALAAGARRRRSSFPSFDDALANFAAKPPLNIFTADSLRGYVYHGFELRDDGQVHLKCDAEHEARTYEAGGTHRTWHRLGEVEVPVWVVSGAVQPTQPSEHAAEVADRIPGSRYVQLDHLGHFGPMQAPDEIAGIVRQACASS